MMQNVLEQLELTAARFPDKTAVACGDSIVAFRELTERASRLGAAVKTEGKNRPVGVIAGRETDTVVFFFAALYSGNYYVPIDPDMPPEKKQSILDETGMTVILGTEENRALLEPLNFKGTYLTPAQASDTACPIPAIGGDDPLYMVYTSGSTGKPKGILKSHRAEISYIETYCDYFGFSEDEVMKYTCIHFRLASFAPIERSR